MRVQGSSLIKTTIKKIFFFLLTCTAHVSSLRRLFSRVLEGLSAEFEAAFSGAAFSAEFEGAAFLAEV